MRSDFWAVAVMVLVVVGSRPAHAGDPIAEAAELYSQGSSAFARSEFRIAALAFEAACDKAPRGPTAMSAALAWEAAGDAARAADDFALALALGDLAQPETVEAKEKHAALVARLGRLVLTGKEGVGSVAHATNRRLPVEVHVVPGEYQVTFVDAAAKETRLEVRVAAGERLEVPLPPPPPPRVGVAAPPLPPAESAPESGLGAQRIVGVTSIAIAVTATAATAVLGAFTLATRDDYEATGFADRDLYDRGVALRTWTNVSLGVSGVFSVLGAVLLSTASNEPAVVSVRHDGLIFRFD